jgi:hypothetical protein
VATPDAVDREDIGDDIGDALYALPLEEFTAARNALAKELARQGDKPASAAVKKLQKPTRTAWALNQLARRQGEDIDALLAAGDRLREAQERALGGDASGLRAANRAEQDQVDRLVDAALALGVVDGPARDRLRNTLRAAAQDPSVGELLRRGRLVADVEAAGFGLEGLAPTGRTDAAGASEPAPTDDEPSPAARREAVRLGQEADIARDRAERLSEDATRAAERADAARREAETASAAAEDARARAEEAQRRADEARRRADEAAEALKATPR